MKITGRQTHLLIGDAAVLVERYRRAEEDFEKARRREVEINIALPKVSGDKQREDLVAELHTARREKEAARSILRGFESPGQTVAILEEVLLRFDRLQHATMALRDAAPGRTRPSKKYDAALAQVDEVLNGRPDET